MTRQVQEGAERAALRNLDIINSRRFAAVHVRCSGAPEISASTEGDHRQTTDGGRKVRESSNGLWFAGRILRDTNGLVE